MVAWSAENKFQLLLNIIGQNATPNINYESLAASMGPEFTVESVKQAFKKIKRDAGAGVPGSIAAPKKSTPRTPRKRKGDEASNWNGGEDDEEVVDGGSPKKAKKVGAKLEAKDEDED